MNSTDSSENAAMYGVVNHRAVYVRRRRLVEMRRVQPDDLQKIPVAGERKHEQSDQTGDGAGDSAQHAAIEQQGFQHVVSPPLG